MPSLTGNGTGTSSRLSPLPSRGPQGTNAAAAAEGVAASEVAASADAARAEVAPVAFTVATEVGVGWAGSGKAAVAVYPPMTTPARTLSQLAIAMPPGVEPPATVDAPPPAAAATEASWRAWAESVAAESTAAAVAGLVASGVGVSAAPARKSVKRVAKKKSSKAPGPPSMLTRSRSAAANAAGDQQQNATASGVRGAAAGKPRIAGALAARNSGSRSRPQAESCGAAESGGVVVGTGASGNSGALALGASVVELKPSHETFALCVDLLRRQAFCSAGSGVGLSVLRVMQIQDHFVDLASLLRSKAASSTTSASSTSDTSRRTLPARRADVGAKGGGLDTSPWLGFVSGELNELSSFVRTGLRLLGDAASRGQLALTRGVDSAPLVISESLDASEAWGGPVRRSPFTLTAEASQLHEAMSDEQQPASLPSLRVWRVVLAVCWPDAPRAGTGGAASPTALPAFIIDYSVERQDAQLGFAT